MAKRKDSRHYNTSLRKTHRETTMTRKSRRNVTAHNVAYIVRVFFNMLMNVKLYHWSTTNYARHTSSDALYNKLSSLIDQFVETYMGRHKRPEFEKNTVNIQVQQFNDDNIVEALREYCYFLEYEVPKHVNESDSDILSIRDEILAEINKTLYLFTMY